MINARLKTTPIKQWEIGWEYRRRLKLAFDEAGIEIPFSHRSLYFGEASKLFITQLLESVMTVQPVRSRIPDFTGWRPDSCLQAPILTSFQKYADDQLAHHSRQPERTQSDGHQPDGSEQNQ